MNDALLQRLRTVAQQAVPSIADLAASVCEIPAPTGSEHQRAAFVAQQLRNEELEPTIDAMGNVVARLRCKKTTAPKARTLMVSAHTDTVFPANTPLKVTRQNDTLTGPGIGDNCLADACMIALPGLLKQAGVELAGDLLLVGNVGEEGLGNLRGMREVFNQYRDELGACLVLEGHGLGRVIHQAVGSKRIGLTFTAPGGHSWTDFGTPSAIHALGSAIHHISQLNVTADPKVTFNVGLISGGTSVNTIAPTATAVIDMRSTCPDALSKLDAQVQAIIESLGTPQVTPEVEVLGERPAGSLPLETPIVRHALDVLRDMGLSPQCVPSSTDANIPIAHGMDSVCIGLTTGYKAHTVEETIRIAPIAQGVEQLLRLVADFPYVSSSK